MMNGVYYRYTLPNGDSQSMIVINIGTYNFAEHMRYQSKHYCDLLLGHYYVMINKKVVYELYVDERLIGIKTIVVRHISGKTYAKFEVLDDYLLPIMSGYSFLNHCMVCTSEELGLAN